MNYKLSMVALVSTLILPATASAHVGTHDIQTGDTLSKIAADHDTDWNRLYDKNVNIQDPNIIYAGDRLEVPSPTAKLISRATKPASRAIPVQKKQATQKPPRAVKKQKRSFAKVVPKKAVRQTVRTYSGNTYTPGQCTWHVKNLKASLPNGLGSAYQWLGRARAMGLATGSTPRVGAAGVRSNHVVYVLKVSGPQVLISEMNYNWTPYAQRTIWKPAGNYTYIY